MTGYAGRSKIQDPRSKSRAKAPPRGVRLLQRPAGGAPGVFLVRVGRRVDGYTFTADGPGWWRVVKLGAPAHRYRVRTAGLSVCQCKAAQFNRNCRHVKSLRALLAAGLL